MPCPCKECSCGDDCKCKPGQPGCGPCGEFQSAKKAEAAAAASATAATAATADASAKPFTLLVTLTFTDSSSSKTFLDSFIPYAAWVTKNEPNTLQYQLMKSDKTDKEFVYCIIERYADKERDFVTAHRSSPQFTEFRSVLKELQDDGLCVVCGESYVDM
jgi:quinol monooxygenase YgiN